MTKTGHHKPADQAQNLIFEPHKVTTLHQVLEQYRRSKQDPRRTQEPHSTPTTIKKLSHQMVEQTLVKVVNTDHRQCLLHDPKPVTHYVVEAGFRGVCSRSVKFARHAR
jgi:hypothetical protein